MSGMKHDTDSKVVGGECHLKIDLAFRAAERYAETRNRYLRTKDVDPVADAYDTACAGDTVEASRARDIQQCIEQD
jgi:hypothetical protein